MGVIFVSQFDNNQIRDKMFAFISKHYVPYEELINSGYEDHVYGPNCYDDGEISFKDSGCTAHRHLWNITSWMSFVAGKVNQNGQKFIYYDRVDYISIGDSEEIQVNDNGVVIYKSNGRHTESENKMMSDYIEHLSYLWKIENSYDDNDLPSEYGDMEL